MKVMGLLFLSTSCKNNSQDEYTPALSLPLRIKGVAAVLISLTVPDAPLSIKKELFPTVTLFSNSQDIIT